MGTVNKPEAGKGREPLVIIPGDEDQRRGYRIKSFGKPPKQWPNYECIYCQFRTLWLFKMEKHQLEGEHPWAYPGQNPAVPGQVRQKSEPEYE